MIRPACDDEHDAPGRPFWQVAILAVIAGAASTLAHHVGKGVREALAARRKRQPSTSEPRERGTP